MENRVLPYADIKAAYKKVIATSESLSCKFDIYSINTYKQSAYVSGHYEAVQFFVDHPFVKIFEGDIQWFLVREEGVLRIKDVNYGKNQWKTGIKVERPEQPIILINSP
jgi:hypothetical protein